MHKMGSGFHISNGLGWSPDNKVFYFTDSGRKTIYAYDFDPASGEIGASSPPCPRLPARSAR